jgi:coenzyme F420-0:L-glutamate ligase/coenzyme F420-1:gamma-L-glutamate ligase
VSELRLVALASSVKVQRDDDLVTLLLDALSSAGEELRHHDLLIVTSKVVSKSEGQVVAFDGSERHKVAIVEQESVRVLRRRGPLRITETRHGFINANAGVDLSNTDEGTAVLLPKDADRSARRIQSDVARRTIGVLR